MLLDEISTEAVLNVGSCLFLRTQHYYSNLQKVAPDRWIFTSSQTFSPTGSSGLPYSIWVRDANTWGANETGRVVKRE